MQVRNSARNFATENWNERETLRAPLQIPPPWELAAVFDVSLTPFVRRYDSLYNFDSAHRRIDKVAGSADDKSEECITVDSAFLFSNKAISLVSDFTVQAPYLR